MILRTNLDGSEGALEAPDPAPAGPPLPAGPRPCPQRRHAVVGPACLETPQKQEGLLSVLIRHPAEICCSISCRAAPEPPYEAA